MADHPGRMCLGRTTALETLQGALHFFKIGGTFLQFGTINLGTLVEPGILDGRCGGNSEQFGQPQMFLSESAGRGVAQGKQPQRLV